MYIDIKDKMKEKGLNKNQLSKETKIGYQAICKIYDGTTERIYLNSLEALCKVLDCTPNDILKK